MKKGMARSNIEFYTVHASRLLEGRKGNINKNIRFIPGFVYFANTISIIVRDSSKGNPYAKWWLHRAKERLHNIKKILKSHEERLAKRELNIGIEIQFDSTIIYENPVTFVARLGTPYAWELAGYLKRFDNFCLTAIKQNAIAIIDEKTMYQEFRTLNKVMVACMNEPIKYISIELTKENIFNEDNLYKKAVARMGEIPLVFIEGNNNENANTY